MAVQGAFYWGGVRALLHGSYTLGLGVTPGLATLAIPPQPNGVSMTGTLSIRYGSTSIEFPDCRVVKLDFHADGSGRKFWMLHIADGRWKWRYGVINGYYNRRLSNGLLDEVSKKTPRDLVKLLAEAIGIRRIDVSALPNKSFPFTDWEWKDRPDTLLAQILDSFACRLAYNAKGDVRVVVVGKGAALPKENALDYQIGIDPSESPEKLVFVAGRSHWNVDVDLEPVGEELNGEIRPIDKLTYAPIAGWKIGDIPRFTCLKNKRMQQQAQKCIWRWFRPKVPFKIGNRNVDELWQVLPMPGYQLIPTDNFGFVEEYSKDNFLTQPPWVYGEYIKNSESYKPTAIAAGGNLIDVAAGIITHGFGVDSERGLIQFSRPMYLIDQATGSIAPPKIKVRAAFGYRDKRTRQFEHWSREFALPNGTKGTKPRYIVREDLGYREGRDIAAGKLDGPVWNNDKDLIDLANHYFAETKREYEVQTPEVATLPGFHNVRVDGAIHTVRWWVGEDGKPYTQVTRNTEQSPAGLSWSDRRFYEDVTREIIDGHRGARRQPV